MALHRMACVARSLHRCVVRPQIIPARVAMPLGVRFVNNRTPSDAFIGEPAPLFNTNAVIDEEIKPVSLEEFQGKWTCLLFYPKDFTFVCPTELIAFSDRASDFEALGAKVLAISTDTEETHLAWVRTPRRKGGLGIMQIPIVADTTKKIAKAYGVLLEDKGIALRGLFIIDPKGILQQITINNLDVGRSVDETLRLLQALKHVEKHGVVCPANWKPGDKTMIAHPDKSQEYFSSVADTDTAMSNGNIKVVTKPAEYLAVTQQAGIVFAYFSAEWCGKCRQIAPHVAQLSHTHPDVTFINIDVNGEAIEEFVDEMKLPALPAFRIFKDGKEVGAPISGFKKRLIAERLSSILK